ncbi:unnamed protein product [Mytilus edulis]|uniref:Tyr recombinase domain-containing protein n=1 Tax=Mytilus edulis TaxID=6550 RepID=A0A8S3S1L9_MYTED|nr:unnamed protein product [Mytilus edulis]
MPRGNSKKGTPARGQGVKRRRMADPKEKEQPIASVVNPRSSVVPFPEPSTKCISDTNSNSEPSMDSITEESARLFSDSLAGNTWKSYSRARSVLDSFQLLYTLDKVWPVPVEQLVQFIAYLSLKHFSPATVRLYISGISFSHKERNLEDTTKNFVVSKMLEGLHRNHPQRDNRAPVTLPLLRQITDALPSICSSTYESLLFKSSFILAFFAMLRVSEFTTKNKSDSSTEALQLSDVVVSDCQLKINIKKSKTDQRGYSTFIVINKYRDNASICPVLTLKKYLAARPAVSGCYHLFMHFDGSPLTRYQLSAMLRKSVNFCNIPNPNLLKSHSFRIGAATEASKRGINDEAIKKWGRWSSGAFERYIRIPW